MKKTMLLLIALIAISFNSAFAYAQDSIFDTSSSSLFNNQDEFLSPDQAFQYSFYQKDSLLTLSFNIAEGYYLYKSKFKFTADNAVIKPVSLPTGKSHEDEFFGVQEIYVGETNFQISFEDIGENATLSIRYQGCAEKGLCFPPEIKTIELSPMDSSSASNTTILGALTENEVNTNTTDGPPTTDNTSEQYQLANMLKGDNLLLTLVAFFVGGLLLSFTPCVFPMYPILTGIIVGQGDKLTNKSAFKLSFIYVQGMAITYTILGIVVALAGAQFQAMFQHPAVLITLSVIFILLAMSMFGVYNLALPNSWQNKLNQLSNKQQGGSAGGVFTMGVISGLVASPCTTAPLTGALLYISQSGDVVLGASALYALSLGMGIPLLIIGSSGGKLLPKAGNWMNIIKNIFGLLLLAVPIFLLERLLAEQIVSLLWSALLIMTGGYFFWVNHNSKKTPWLIVRAVIIFAILFFGVQKALTVILPTPSTSQETSHGEFIDVTSLSELEAKVADANAQGKTVMVDLYADWCVACKEFEQYTFPDANVKKALANTMLIRIDLTDTGSKSSVELMKHFNVFGLPSILFFNTSGEELTEARVTGFVGAEKFAEHINKIFN
ncbi:protein-disulfide reductase DsbD [Thalassotalea ganghwensis]